MNIKIQKLKLTNFKCFKGDNEFDFEGKDVVTIKGRNGAGKTTIADAILWCLFGKNSQGQSDFDLKTHGEDGKPIPHLDHSVELNLICDAGYITLSRTLKETWVKKRGSEEQVFKNNTTEYLVNGDSYTAADYKKYIAGLVSEDIFRAITNPMYFTSLKWQEQRQFLTQMVGAVEVPDNEEFVALLKQLTDSGEDIIAYKKHLSYQIKQIKDKLEKIPVRLEEQNKALPEKLDWDALTMNRSKAEQELKEIDEKISQLQQGNGADLKREEIRNQINEANTKAEVIKNGAMDLYSQEYARKSAAINQASIRFNEALNNQKLMEQKIQADERLIERCKEIDYEAELQKLRDQWPSSKFVIDPQAAFCPTCGQAIPDEQYQEKVEEMKRNFNLNREAKIKELNEKASKIKKEQADAAEELKRLEQTLSDDQEQLESIKKSINDIFAEKAKLEKEHVKTIDEILSENEEYNALTKKIYELKEQLSSVTASDEDTKTIDDLKAVKESVMNGLRSLSQKLASHIQYKHVMSLIDGIKEEEKNLLTQLSELERQEDIASRYQNIQNQILEDRINEHFSITRWRLFKTVNNGGDPFDEPYCECYDLNGTAYHDGLNQAARLNLGLDIINTLCKHYGVSAPIVLDNAESTINIIDTEGQQIRLQVFNSDLTLA